MQNFTAQTFPEVGIKTEKILVGQDPYVAKYKDTYLLILSADVGSKLYIKQFKDPRLRRELHEVSIWESSTDTVRDHKEGWWAPELHTFPNISDKWYVYFAGCYGKNCNHRMYVLESDTSDPLGSYHELGKIYDPSSDRWAIDLTVLQYGGKLYAVWSGWETDVGDFPQNLYIAEMANPWTIKGPRVLISKPEFAWEKSVAAINEGPQVLIHSAKSEDGFSKGGEHAEDKVFIVYSADASWSPAYKLGLLELVGTDPLNPSAWKKHPEAVFEQGPTEFYGPGHASFLTESKANYIYYHHKLDSGSGWDRAVRSQKFDWSEDGLPLFGCPR